MKTSILHNEASYNELLEFMKMPLETQRIKYHIHACSNYYEYVTRAENEEFIYIAIRGQKLKYNNKKFYTTSNNTTGISYNKTTKKLKLWFGKQYYALPPYFRNILCDEFNLPYFTESISALMSNSIFNKLVCRKISTDVDIVTEYFKTIGLHKKGIDIAKVIESCDFKYGHCNHVRQYKEFLVPCSDPAKAVEIIHSTKSIPDYWYSLAYYARAFDEPYDPTISKVDAGILIEKYSTRVKAFEIEEKLNCLLLY